MCEICDLYKDDDPVVSESCPSDKFEEYSQQVVRNAGLMQSAYSVLQKERDLLDEVCNKHLKTIEELKAGNEDSGKTLVEMVEQRKELWKRIYDLESQLGNAESRAEAFQKDLKKCSDFSDHHIQALKRANRYGDMIFCFGWRVYNHPLLRFWRFFVRWGYWLCGKRLPCFHQLAFDYVEKYRNYVDQQGKEPFDSLHELLCGVSHEDKKTV